MPKQKKAAQPKLNKAQLAERQAAIQQATVYKNLIREHVYPVLQRLETMSRAQQVAEITKTVMTAKMNDYWSGKTVADLDLVSQLAEEGDFKDADVFKDLILALNELPIAEAHKLLEGMGGAFDGYARKMASEKKMTDLPVEEILN